MKTFVLSFLLLFFVSISHATLPPGVTPTPAPATASGLSGGPFYYEVTGSTVGFVYGTDFYAGNSSIATAAVHDGLLADGETGVIELTLVGRLKPVGSTQNGITSYGYNFSLPCFEMELCVVADFSIISQPQGGVLAAGTPITLSVGVDGTGHTFQWYIGEPGDITQPVPANNSSNLTVTAANPPSTYWVEISNASGSVSSLGATVAAFVTEPSNDWQDITVNVQGALSPDNEIGPLLATGSELYVLGDTGIFRTSDNGNSFSTLNTVSGAGYDLGLTALRFVERAGDYIYVGTDPGSYTATLGYTAMHRLQPGDTVWEQAAQPGLTGPINVSVDDVSYDPGSDMYYAASAFAGCYVSSNGLHWTERRNGLPETGLPYGAFVNARSVDAHEGKVFLNLYSVLAENNGGVYVSEDHGLSWTRSGGVGGTPGGLVRFGSRLLYATSGPATPDDGVYYTDDGGNWKYSPFLGHGFNIRANSTHLFTARERQLLFSATDGLTWDALDDLNLPADFYADWIEPSETHLFLYGTDSQGPRLYRRTLASLNLSPATQFVVDPSEAGSTVYANPGQTLFFSGLAGGANISYQWKIGGVDIPGATAPDLNLEVTDETEGNLTLEVSGDGGTIESQPILITRIPAEPGFQDMRFVQPPLPMQGSLVLYDDYRVLQIEAPRMQLLSTNGQVLVRNELIGDSRIRRGFIDSQGRLVGFGEFSVVRLDPDTLTPDPSFTNVAFSGVGGTTNTTIRLNDVIELPGQGYLCAVNNNTTLNGVGVPSLVLLDYDGVQVPGFINPFINYSPSYAPSALQLELTPAGKILVQVASAKWANGDSIPSMGLVRLESSGARDLSFSQNNDNIPIANRTLRFFTQQPDGKILYSVDNSRYRPKRLNADGTYDAGFNGDDTDFERTIFGFITEPSGKVVVYGEFEAYGAQRAIGHARLLSNGDFDPTYNAEEGFKFYNTQKAVGDAVYDDRGFVYYVSSDGGGYRVSGQTGVVRVFVGEESEPSVLDLYLEPFGLPAGQQGEEDDPDGDGFKNIFELAYQTDPSAGNDAVELLPGAGSESGAVLNGILGSAVLDPAKTYYTQTVRLPKNPPAGVTVRPVSTDTLPLFGNGSSTLVAYGAPIDEGDTILQTYYQAEDMSVAPRGYFTVEAFLD
ncbi:LCCL domain-containing protein [Pontiella agarivorans]|uniref:LCCL domain-containing protein n=1 Tax=Pontiella agarivorans TaxID=3038953 RepID=A0ABU5N0P4_9BACT|nr:LCCL domain-containing protein [Pontiella agarivorans]MDZ8119926.1 LCCL domain-containing protein [Pontiella agarivorans]